MSSVFKGIKKVFKKVFSAVKKVAPVVLGIGALVFTGGAALGLAPALGGWGAAASAITAKLGAGGVLGSALTGAITQAGYGAVIGGVGAEFAGGNFADGMRQGAAGGAVTGGLMGTFTGLTATQAPAAGGAKTFPGPERMPAGVGESVAPTATGLDPSMAAQSGQAAPVSTAAGGASAGGGLLSRVGGWMERNPELAGGLVKGVGAGLLSGADADAEADLLRERQRLTSENYRGTDPGQQYRGAAPGSSGQTPTERFDPRTYGSFEYQYDPKVGRIVKVPA